MLHIYIRNDETGTPRKGNYWCDVHVNTEVIASCRVTGHVRKDGWIKLVRLMLDKIEKERTP